MKWWQKYVARKFLITIAAFIVGDIALWQHLITGSQWITLISIIFSAYHISDTTQCHSSFHDTEPNITNTASTITKVGSIENMIVKGSPG